MKIGIIIHTNTNHTLEVANELKTVLSKNHEVHIDKVTSLNEKESQNGNVELKDIPSIKSYDYLIFGAPINGFALTKTMVAYLKQLDNIKPIKAMVYVTHFFPGKGLGGKQGIDQFYKMLSTKNMLITSAAVVPWTFGKRKAITNLLHQFKQLIDE